MESNIQEAVRIKAVAEHHFLAKDFVSAHNYALKAHTLCSELEGLSQMVATFGVYHASEAKINGEHDFYSILGMEPSAEKSKLKKQYKKLAVLLHPDKNKTVGADGAFRLVSDAYALLSDNVKRSSYDQRRNLYVTDGYRSDTFWTVCTSCHVQYEYLRKYVNKRLSCKNCRGVFIAVETGLSPANGAFPYCTYSYGPSPNGYGSQSCGPATYVPATPGNRVANGASGHHTGQRSSGYASNISFQGNQSGNSAGVLDPSGLSASSFLFYPENGGSSKPKPKREVKKVKTEDHLGSTNGRTSKTEVLMSKRGRPSKRRKLVIGVSNANGHAEISHNTIAEAKVPTINETVKVSSKISSLTETSTKRWTPFPAIDTRQFLIDKARAELIKKLGEMKVATEVAEVEKKNTRSEVVKSYTTAKLSGPNGVANRPELKRNVSMSITVPDSDFHDFDQDRTEECFKPRQIWALYDEEDGMPRLYCLIREVISLNPFKIFISYLNSKTDTEFGAVNWLVSGFTKSCGSFRVFHSEEIEQVNIFSHLLSKEKTGRGGCVRIYPRKGDIWAVYRNWSPDWNRTTPEEVRHQYEMVEILEDYSEENGVWITPLIKLDGFKTVYQRNSNQSAVRWVARREMLRFSHQVPSCPLDGNSTDLPEGCWDLDPAATPDELLQGETEFHNTLTPKISHEKNPVERKVLSDEKFDLSDIFGSTPPEGPADEKLDLSDIFGASTPVETEMHEKIEISDLFGSTPVKQEIPSEERLDLSDIFGSSPDEGHHEASNSCIEQERTPMEIPGATFHSSY